MVIPAKSTDVLKNGTSMAMVSSTAKSKLTDLIEITPVVISFDPSKAIVNIEVSNHGNRPVLIQSSAVIAELQQVSFVDDLDNSFLDEKQVIVKETFLQQFNMSDTDLTPEQRERASDLLWNFNDIFSENEFDLGHTGLIKHEIHLTDDAPFKERHCRIPIALFRGYYLIATQGTIMVIMSNKIWNATVCLVVTQGKYNPVFSPLTLSRSEYHIILY